MILTKNARKHQKFYCQAIFRTGLSLDNRKKPLSRNRRQGKTDRPFCRYGNVKTCVLAFFLTGFSVILFGQLLGLGVFRSSAYFVRKDETGKKSLFLSSESREFKRLLLDQADVYYQRRVKSGQVSLSRFREAVRQGFARWNLDFANIEIQHWLTEHHLTSDNPEFTAATPAPLSDGTFCQDTLFKLNLEQKSDDITDAIRFLTELQETTTPDKTRSSVYLLLTGHDPTENGNGSIRNKSGRITGNPVNAIPLFYPETKSLTPVDLLSVPPELGGLFRWLGVFFLFLGLGAARPETIWALFGFVPEWDILIEYWKTASQKCELQIYKRFPYKKSWRTGVHGFPFLPFPEEHSVSLSTVRLLN